MYTHNLQKGQSLIEIVFATTIFTIGMLTIGYLIIDARTSLHYSTDSTQARLLASEGIAAVGSIRDSGFNQIPAGTYGLVLSQGFWTLASSSDEWGKFTRTITIEDLDKDNKEVTSLITWSKFGGREKSLSYSTRFSNWNQTGGEAGDLSVSTDNVVLGASSTALHGLFFQNTGNEDIVITNMTVAWSTPALLERITIGGVDVFTASTSAPITSGIEIDILDYQVWAFSSFHSVDSLTFDGSVSGTNFTVRFTLQDGSVRSIYISP